MAKFSTTKPNIDFTRKEYGRTLITTIYTMISTWNNATNWTLTIPRDGRYKITASGNMLALESSTAGNIVCYCRLARDGVAITGTARSVGISINAATYAYNQSPFEITWEDTFIAGEVITLQAAYLAGAGNECRIEYSAGSIEPFMSYELVKQTVSVRDVSGDISTTAVDTGKNDSDGKRIYRREWTGTTGAGVTSTLAIGITIDRITAPMILKIDSSSFGWQGPEGSSNLAAYFTNMTQNDITLYHNAAHLQSRPYRLIMEYTV